MATRSNVDASAAPATERPGKGRPRRARDSLSREVIIAAADAVVQREGLDRLTFQSIGHELGAHPTSIYRHFRDKDDLLLGLIDMLRARSYSGSLTATDDWMADLRAQAHLIHDHYMRYPDFALQMALRRPTDLASIEFSIGALRRGGYGPQQCGLYVRALGHLVRSAASIQSALAALPDSVVDDEELTGLDRRRPISDSYPNVAWVGGHLPAVRDPGTWTAALDLFLENVFRHAPVNTGS